MVFVQSILKRFSILNSCNIDFKGGATKYMNRHSSLQKFIQKHKSKAEIRITLGNKGDDPYNEDLYGDKIVFARNIYSNGSAAQVIRHGENYKVLKKGSKLLKFLIVAIILNILTIR